MKLAAPWDCPPPEVTEQIRTIKEERQRWYQNPQTRHWFYTGYEGLNPNQRVTKDNPALYLRALIADLDPLRPMTREQVDELIEELPIKPNYLEKSLGNGWRLVWLLADPIRFPDDKELISASLCRISHTLGIADLKCLDQGSWDTPHRLYCNGGQWYMLEEKPVDKNIFESEIFSAALDIAKKSKAREIPLPRVEELIKKKYPNWEWPGEFVEGSQGPSWWIEGSESPKSAIVHADGMWTFAGHREKSKYPWADIVGAGAVEKDRAEKISNACADMYHDGRNYFTPRHGGGYNAERPDVIRRSLQVNHGLYSERAKKQKNSEIDEALAFIESEHRVDYAAPILYKPRGVIRVKDTTYLNTSQVVPIKPPDEEHLWLPDGDFPFIYDWLTKIFVTEEQLEHFKSWLATFYQNALRGTPHQGQAVFLAGGVGIGKTLLSHWLVGQLMGGFGDASNFLMGQDSFGGELFAKPVWAVDDQIMNSDSFMLRMFTNFIKKHVANSTHTLHEKYMKKVVVEWYGRLFITCNLDAWSQTILPALEDSITDKVIFYKMCEKLPPDYFPVDVEEILKREIVPFAAYMRDYKIPDKYRGSSRFRVKSYQEPSLAQAAYQNSGSIGHMEIVVEYLKECHKMKDENVIKDGWRGNATSLIRDIRAIPSMEGFVKNMTPRQMNIHLASLAALHDGTALELSEKNVNRIRIWTIKLKKNENDKRD
jgi:hypothetical protein